MPYPSEGLVPSESLLPSDETPRIAGTGAKPPLDLEVEVTLPDGSTVRWDAQAGASKRPTGLSFTTQRYTGFGSAKATLARRIDLDYPDLGLLRGLTFIGADGSIAFDGRIGGMPRSFQEAPEITVEAQGWMSHATSRPFVECYVDRDLSKWTAPGTRRALQFAESLDVLAGFTQRTDLTTGTPVIELEVNGKWDKEHLPTSEAWWGPFPGIAIGEIYWQLLSYAPPKNGVTLMAEGGGWEVDLALSEADYATASMPNSGNMFTALGSEPSKVDKAAYFKAPSDAFICAFLQFGYGAAGGREGDSYWVHIGPVAVYGDHGLTPVNQAGEPEPLDEPGGFPASTLIRNITERFASKLDASGVQDTDFAIPQAAFFEETKPYDAFTSLNAYHRWELAVYENRKLLFYPIDLGDYDWEVRLSDPGVKATLQGDSVQNLCNGVCVTYVDLATGREARLTPDTHEELAEPNPNNPANITNEPLWTGLKLSFPTTEEGALQIGRAYLAEFNQPQAPGSLTIQGHVRDKGGNWQQAWKVRSSARILIADLPNESVRVVGETEWNHDTKTLTCAIDSGFKRLDAILARYGVALEAANLSLPSAP